MFRCECEFNVGVFLTRALGGRSSRPPLLFPLYRNYSYRFPWWRITSFLSCATTLFFFIYYVMVLMTSLNTWRKTAIVCLCDEMIRSRFSPMVAPKRWRSFFIFFLRIFSTYSHSIPNFSCYVTTSFFILYA